MSSLTPGDAKLHYEDGSHRWYHPSDPDLDEQWLVEVRAHSAEHRASMANTSRRAAPYCPETW